VSRRHFLLSDQSALEKGHRDWYFPIDAVCSSEKYGGYEFDGLLEGKVTLGDVNHDGEVTLLDLLMLRRWQASGNVCDFCRFCADLNLDGRADEADAELFRRKLISSD
jgi:hypothetical protein